MYEQSDCGGGAQPRVREVLGALPAHNIHGQRQQQPPFVFAIRDFPDPMEARVRSALLESLQILLE